MPKSAALLVAVLAFPALISGIQQHADGDAPFRTIRGQVVADDPGASPLRRVRIALSGRNVVSSPTYTDEQGRFELVVPASAAYSLKFTKAGGTITMGAAPRDDHVIFWVKDTGSGILPQELALIFERYWRANQKDRKGSGLGLSICKGIVEAHGGSIWAESSQGLGTTMLFTLPVLQDRPPVESAAVMNVLIVDDRPENLYALAAILDGQGYRTITAASGQEALRVALQEELSVVLLDVEMPEMNGFEIATHLKLLKRTKSIPIVFITAHGEDPERVYRAYAAGGADYLVKPLDPEIVRRKVAVFAELGRRRAPRESGSPTG